MFLGGCWTLCDRRWLFQRYMQYRNYILFVTFYMYIIHLWIHHPSHNYNGTDFSPLQMKEFDYDLTTNRLTSQMQRLANFIVLEGENKECYWYALTLTIYALIEICR